MGLFGGRRRSRRREREEAQDVSLATACGAFSRELEPKRRSVLERRRLRPAVGKRVLSRIDWGQAKW